MYLDFSGLPDITPIATVKYITNADTVNLSGAQIIETYHASTTLIGQSAPLQYFTYSTTQTAFTTSGGTSCYANYLSENHVSMI